MCSDSSTANTTSIEAAPQEITQGMSIAPSPEAFTDASANHNQPIGELTPHNPDIQNPPSIDIKDIDIKDVVEKTATAIGFASQVIPYAGDYIAVVASIVNHAFNPSAGSAVDVGRDFVGAVLPGVPAIGTINRAIDLASLETDKADN